MMTTSENAMNDGLIPPIKETIGTPAWRARRATSRLLGRAAGLAVLGLLIAAVYRGARLALK